MDKGMMDREPYFTTPIRYLEKSDLTPVLKGLIQASALPLRDVEIDFAQDSPASLPQDITGGSTTSGVVPERDEVGQVAFDVRSPNQHRDGGRRHYISLQRLPVPSRLRENNRSELPDSFRHRQRSTYSI